MLEITRRKLDRLEQAQKETSDQPPGRAIHPPGGSTPKDFQPIGRLEQAPVNTGKLLQNEHQIKAQMESHNSQTTEVIVKGRWIPEQRTQCRQEESRASPRIPQAAPAASTSRWSPDQRTQSKHGENLASHTIPQTGHAAPLSRWIPEQRRQCRPEKTQTSPTIPQAAPAVSPSRWIPDQRTQDGH